MTYPTSQTLVFRLSCWLLGVVAFTQILVAGVALAMRVESGRTVKVVEKIVPSTPTVVLNRPIELPPRPLMTLEHLPEPEEDPSPLPPPRPLLTPMTADPVAERLIQEAKTARVGEDMMSAITKLEQVLLGSPHDANALYEMGLCLETMGIYDRARQYYNQVFQLGTTGAGQLYLQAAEKLKQGFEQPQDKIGRIKLGYTRVYKDPNIEAGEKVIITIPVQAVPGEQIEGRDLEVSVNFFDEVGVRKEITAANTIDCPIETKWVTEPTDWATGEELLRVTYTIPVQDPQQQHLFGEKRYYGQVVELSYKGELIDSLAQPRILARKLNKPYAPSVALDQEMPTDYNPDNPLLPNAPAGELSTSLPPDFSQQDLPPLLDLPPADETPLPVPPEYQNLPQR